MPDVVTPLMPMMTTSAETLFNIRSQIGPSCTPNLG